MINAHIRITVLLLFIIFKPLSLHAQGNYFLTKYDKRNTKLSANIISDLAVDSNQTLFVATPSQLYVYNGIDFTKLNIPSKQRIISVINNTDGSVLTLLSNGHVYKVNNKNSKIELVISNLKAKYPSYSFNYIFLDGPINFTNKIINKSHLKYNFFLTQSVFNKNKNQFLIRNEVKENLYKIYWLDTFLNKTDLIQISYKEKTRFLYNHEDILTLIDGTFYSSISNKKFNFPKNLNPHKHFYFVQKPHQPLLLIQENIIWASNTNYQWELITNNLPPDVILSAAVFNKKLNHWYIGTQSDGLFILKPKKFIALNVTKSTAYNDFYLQLPINNNNIITNNGIIANNTGNLKYSQIKKIYTNNNSLKLSASQYLVQSNDEIYEFDVFNDKIKLLKKGPNMGSTNYFKLSVDSIMVFKYDSIFYYEPKKFKFTYITKNFETHLNIYRIVKIKNNLWISSCAGIHIFDLKSNVFVKNLFPGNCVREIFPTPNGVLVSLYGTGLILVQDKSFKTTNIPLDFRQSLTHAHAIYKSPDKYLIIPTNTGILKLPEIVIFKSLNKKALTQQPQYFNEQDGLPTNEFNGGTDPGYINFGDTQISFPSLKGLIQIHPQKFISNYTISSFRVASIERSGEPVLLANNLIHLPTYTPEITLKLDLTYWGNSFNLPLYYKYKNKYYFIPIEKINNLRILLDHYGYENLEFFTFENKKIKSLLKINIFRNYLWYTQWYYLLIGIITLLGFFYIFDTIKNFQSEKKEEKLQRLINDKTLELNALNEELKLRINQLTNSNNNNQFYISVINHDIFAPIKFINLIGNQIAQHKTKVSKIEILENLNVIINSTKRLEILCSNILNHLHSDRYKSSDIIPVVLNTLFLELELFFNIGLKINNNKLIFNLIPDTTIDTNKEALNIILTNLISNANRFTQNGEITVNHKFNAKSQKHTLQITDNGKGISKEILENINSRNLQILNRDSLTYNSYGIGYNLIFKMLELINADLQVGTNTPSGTVITLIIPNLSKSDNGLSA